MSGSERAAGAYPTRVCPRCGAELYADMRVCYGCLYDFERGEGRAGAPGLPPGAGPVAPGDTRDLSGAIEAGAHASEVGVVMRTALMDVWVAVPEKGLSLGRAPDNDVVMHSPAISRSHLRLAPTPDGMEVSDLRATNPARYRGREVRGLVVVPYGETIEVCGSALTMTGPATQLSSDGHRTFTER